MSRVIGFGIAILAGHALAACGSDTDHSEIETRALDDGTARGQALQAQAAHDFVGCTESQAVAKAAGVVFAINHGEIAQADFVLSKIGAVRMRALATQIMTDHQANNWALLTLIKNRDLAPVETSVSNALTSEASAGLAQLQADDLRNLSIDYAQMQIAMHQEASMVVGTVRDLVPASAGDMRGFLADTLTMLGDHQVHATTVLRDLP